MPRIDTAGLDQLAADMEREPLRAAQRIDRMLLAGAEEVKKGWRTAAQENGFKRTGALIDSIGYASRAKKIKELKYIEIYPQGQHRTGPRNAAIAYILHYGTRGSASRRAASRMDGKKFKGKTGIPRTLWVDRAEELSERTRVEAMQRIWTQDD